MTRGQGEEENDQGPGVAVLLPLGRKGLLRAAVCQAEAVSTVAGC